MMQVSEVSLWQRSPRWRWLVLGASCCLGLALLGAPWRVPAPAQPSGTSATFTPQHDNSPPAASPAAQHQAVGAAAPSARVGTVAGGADRRDAFDRTAQVGMPVAKAPAASLATAANAQSQGGVTWQAGPQPMGGSVSGRGLIAAHCCAGPFSTVLASRGVGSGLHYLELTLSATPGDAHAATWTAAGVMASDGLPRGPNLRPGSDEQKLELQVGRMGGQFRNGDVIGLAIDANQRRVHWSHNGRWMNGTPGAQDGLELRLLPGQQIYPFGTMSSPRAGAPEGDRWVANFGATPFRHPLPDGFSAYGTQPAGAAAAPAAPTAGTAPAPVPMVALPKDALMGKSFRDAITMKREVIPLPAGEWSTLAHFRAEPGSAKGDAVILGQIKDRQLTGLVALNAYSHDDGIEKGFPAFKSCSRGDLLAQHTERNEAEGVQRCWWINHAVSVWTEQAAFRAAMGELAQRGVKVPPVLINVGFRRADLRGFASAYYYFNPETAGIASATGTWQDSEWHRSRIATDEARTKYIQELQRWGESWAPIFFAAR